MPRGSVLIPEVNSRVSDTKEREHSYNLYCRIAWDQMTGRECGIPSRIHAINPMSLLPALAEVPTNSKALF